MGRERGGEKKKQTKQKQLIGEMEGFCWGEGKFGMAFLVRVSFLFFFFYMCFGKKLLNIVFFKDFLKQVWV